MSLCKNRNKDEKKCQNCEFGGGLGPKHQRIPECFGSKDDSFFGSVSKVAIVGSKEIKWTPEQKDAAMTYIRDLLTNSEFKVMISGGCPKGGVDIWAESIAGVEFKTKMVTAVFEPEVHQWNNKGKLLGYKSRNLKIARMCDVLYDLEPAGMRSGGTWTAEQAEKLGKKVHYIYFREDGKYVYEKPEVKINEK